MEQIPQKAPNQEQNEHPQFNILIYIPNGLITGKAIAQVIKLFPHLKVEVADNQEEIIKTLTRKPEDIIMLPPDTSDSVRIITKIRNTPDIKHQPVIMAMGTNNNDPNLKQSMKAGADIALPIPTFLVNFLVNLKNIPELISQIEDTYGDAMVNTKQGFYKEYKDKLESRSKETADTEKEVQILKDLFQQKDIQTVLDAGGGEGRIAIPLSEEGYKVTNLDGSQELLDKMTTKTDQVKALQADLRNIPIKDASYDAFTLNWHVLCDILGNKGKRKMLSEAYRVLNNNGVLALDIPDRDKGKMEKDGVYINYPGGKHIFIGYVPSKDETTQLLEEAGFKNIKVKEWTTKTGFPKLSFSANK